MMYKLAAVVFAGALAASAPSASRHEPRAAAWAVRVTLTSSVGRVLQIADATSGSGASPYATGAAYLIDGRGSGRIAATLAHPDVVNKKASYQDPTGSITTEGGFAEAHVTQSSSSARAGVGAGGGSGFALASKLLTFDQQAQLLNQWKQLNDAIFTPLNAVVDKVSPLLGTAGVTLPHLQEIPPAGLIDVADGRAVASSAETASSESLASARADATIGELKLLGGFIEMHDITAEANSESSPGQALRSARSRIGTISIAGIEVVGDSDGFRVAGNDVVSRTVVQPALDLMMGALKQAGLSIAVAGTRSQGDLREASAFEVSWISPQGLVQISVGHAEASAASVGAPIGEIAPPGVPVVNPPGPAPVQVPAVPPVVSGAASAAPAIAAPAARRGPAARSLGPAAARALRTVYLMFLVAGLISSLAYPMLIRRAPRRHVRPTT